MKLYLVHCGFYDLEVAEGVFESHTNFFVVAESFDDARAKAKLHADFSKKRMHVDGLQEVSAVNGFRIEATADASLDGRTLVVSSRHRDLAPTRPATSLV
ncbi:MAG: DUF1543 domain-containing protein [Deltaproteobacteria bacterium]|nr:DUF1543 domain-containing protein [Deltaproteobacteria bacterium]